MPDTHASVHCQLLHVHAAASASRSIANPPAVDPSQHHKERASQPQSKYAIKPYLQNLLRRTPTRTPTTPQLRDSAHSQDLRDMWSSCCSSRCTCRQMLSGRSLMRMRQYSTSSSTCTQQHQHHAASPARPPSTHHSTTKGARRNNKASTQSSRTCFQASCKEHQPRCQRRSS